MQLVGDPDMGFAGLRQFGTSLISHVGLKIRTGLSVQNMMIVDSPGMIDSPVNSGIGACTLVLEQACKASLVCTVFAWCVAGTRTAGDFVGTMSSPRDRGYNFPGVVRWFAERADVILLFFDPDKPVLAAFGALAMPSTYCVRCLGNDWGNPCLHDSIADGSG